MFEGNPFFVSNITGAGAKDLNAKAIFFAIERGCRSSQLI